MDLGIVKEIGRTFIISAFISAAFSILLLAFLLWVEIPLVAYDQFDNLINVLAQLVSSFVIVTIGLLYCYIL